jgi:PAS domain S-box-containing protein
MLDQKSFDKQTVVTVVDHISTMVAYWDKELICQFANAPYLKWFGRKRQDMVGKMTIMELLGASLYELNRPYIHAVLKGEKQTFEREITLPTGEKRFALAHYFPDAENGEIKGFFVQVTDIHDLKLLEKNLKESNQIISNQNRRLHNFANVVSHNLKSYAGNFGSLINLLLAAESEKEKDEIINYLADLSRHFSDTVKNLTQTVSAQNMYNQDHVPCRVLAFADQAIAILKLQIDSCNALVINSIDPDLVLFTNPAYLESILLNLLTNALKYRFPGRRPFIELDTSVQNQKILLRVKDNGLGIDLKKHGAYLFGMNKTFHGNEDANGIGLYITKYQVDSLGGFIGVESEEGVGTTFTVCLNRSIIA